MQLLKLDSAWPRPILTVIASTIIFLIGLECVITYIWATQKYCNKAGHSKGKAGQQQILNQKSGLSL